MSDYPMLISNKLHSFRNFLLQRYNKKVEIFCIMGAGNKNYYKFIFSWNIERANL